MATRLDPKVLFKGFVDSYMKAVKASDGVTSVKPSCTTAIDKAAKDPKLIKNAIDALHKQVDDVKKANATPPNKAKADAFAAAINKITEELKKQIA